MSKLKVDDFRAFFREVYGHEPFAWQEELVRTLHTRHLSGGDSSLGMEQLWPGAVDVPTGLGKTAIIDAFVFLNALHPGAIGRRLFFVVDRRVVVDQAYQHAEWLSGALAGEHPGPVTRLVAERIAAAGSGGGPLRVERMRGGTTWPWQWLDRPDRVAVIVGTAAQIGSRLLFRGYGVSKHRRSIDAALVGTDSVIVVDEAHIAAPMLQSCSTALGIDRVHDEDEQRAVQQIARPAQIVSMSATHDGDAPGWVQRIDPDSETHEAVRRLRSAKRLTTLEIKPGRPGAAGATIAKALAQCAKDLVDDEHQVVGVICNTVRRARRTFRALQEISGRPEGVALLTGRMREYDRDRWTDLWLERFAASDGVRTDGDDAPRQQPTEAEGPWFLVATQTVEVGADLDLDGLVTESASLDALVQRLGRLNRRGRPLTARAVVVHDVSTTAEKSIYGPGHLATWEWLDERVTEAEALGDDGLDVSPLVLRDLLTKLVPEARTAMGREQVPVPTMTAARLATFARTSPTPVPDLPVAPFLYGFRDDDPTVTVVWRSGIARTDGKGVDEGRAGDEIDRCPPRPFEGLELPIAALRRWLSGVEAPDAFTDSGLPGPVPKIDDIDFSRRVVVRTGGSNTEPAWTVVSLDQVKPGDVVVIPTEYGGLDEFGWDPKSTTATDVGDLRAWRDRWIVRIGPALFQQLTLLDDQYRDDGPPPEGLAALEELAATMGFGTDAMINPAEPFSSSLKVLARILVDEERLLTRATPAETVPLLKRAAARTWAKAVAEVLRRWPKQTALDPLLEILATDDDRTPPRRELRFAAAGDYSDDGGSDAQPADPRRATVAVVTVKPMQGPDVSYAEDDTALGTSVIGAQVTLRAHQDDVARRARATARSIGLPDEVVESISMAAGWHDEGKRDPRFQAMLRDGSRLRARAAPEPLAKSGMDPADRRAFRRAASRSGYPRGMRHEALSSRIVKAYLEHATTAPTEDPVPPNFDADLVVHLVASHHGRSRPLLPPVPDDDPPRAADVGLPEGCITAETVDWDSPSRFARLNRRYGHWGLALCETIVRLADQNASAEPGADTTSPDRGGDQ